MRNQTLAAVRSKVKAETHKTLDTSSTSQDAEINQLIETVQQELADAYEWGFLKSRWDSFVPPGQRFTAFPTALSPQGGAASATATIDFNRPLKMIVKWNNIWQGTLYGIDEAEEFNYLDSDRGAVLDPVQRWQYSDETKFEIWPLPASTAQVRFVQNRALTTLQTGATVPPTWNDSATLDLDDILVVLHVSLLYVNDEDEGLLSSRLQKRAADRLKMLLGSNPTRNETITIGRGKPLDRKMIKLVPLVVVGGH